MREGTLCRRAIVVSMQRAEKSMISTKPSVALEPLRILRSTHCADLLSVSRSHSALLRYDGTGPRYTKISRKVILYSLANVEAWVAELSTGSE
jgi:predicted DNA-binding transcriptional regulator AlpA